MTFTSLTFRCRFEQNCSRGQVIWGCISKRFNEQWTDDGSIRRDSLGERRGLYQLVKNTKKKKKKQPLKFILLVKVTLRALTNPKFQNKVYFLFTVRRQLFPARVPLTWLCCALGHEVPASICPQENRGSRGPNTHPLLKSLCLEVKSLLITLLRWDLVTWPHLYMQGNPRNVALVWAAACQQRQDIMER